MSKLRLNAVATQALLDHDFEAAILNGHRKERLRDFNLSEDEFEAVMAIDADNLDQFIHRLRNLMASPVWAA